MGALAHRVLVKSEACALIDKEKVPYDICCDYIFPNYSNTYAYLGEGTIYSLKGKRTGIPNAKETLHFFRLRNDVRRAWKVPALVNHHLKVTKRKPTSKK